MDSFIRLDQYTVGQFTPGAPLWKQLLWFFLGDPLVRSRMLPLSSFKVWVLRSFGATIGEGVNIKPGVRIKFPWRLSIGNHCWIGENAWLDNVAPILIGDHVCISQSVYLCTGNHDWTDATFALRPGEIVLESGSWIAARAVIAPGVRVGQGAVLCLGSVAMRSLDPLWIYAGNPAERLKPRQIRNALAQTESITA